MSTKKEPMEHVRELRSVAHALRSLRNPSAPVRSSHLAQLESTVRKAANAFETLAIAAREKEA